MVVRHALVCIVALILAGCTSPSEDADEPIEQAVPEQGPGFDEPLTFGDPIRVGNDGRWEGSLAIDGDHMVACMHGGFEDDAVFASLDAGATWARLAIERGQEGVTGSSDCDLAIGDDGTWYIIFMDAFDLEGRYRNAQGGLVFGSSQDQGKSWMWTDITAARTSGGLADRPWIHAIGDSTVYLMHKSSSTSPIQSWFQRSDDKGATWSTPISITSVPEFPAERNAAIGKMAVADDGETLYVPIHTWVNDDTPLAGDEPRWLDLAVSHDAGATWTIKPAAGPIQLQDGPHQNPSIGLAGDHLYYGVPLHNETSRVDQAVYTSADEGDTWSEPIVLATAQDYAASAQAYLALDAGPNGTMDAAWYHWDDGWIINMARLDGTELLWSTNITQAQGNASMMEFLWLTHDHDGRAWIAYPLPDDACVIAADDYCLYVVSQSA